MKQNKYTYNNWSGKHTLSLNSASFTYINSDCPDIYNEDGSTLFSFALGGKVYLDPNIEVETADKLLKFIKKSERAFYNYMAQSYSDTTDLERNKYTVYERLKAHCLDMGVI